jgi:hypothetical protein
MQNPKNNMQNPQNGRCYYFKKVIINLMFIQ